MTDDHQEPRAEFPTGLLAGGVVVSFAIMIVLSVFVFGSMGGHGTAVATNTPAAAQQKH